MLTLLIVIVGVIFLFGLVQWARSGALMWDIYELLHGHQSSGITEAGKPNEDARKEDIQKSIQRMESNMDSLLRSSVKVLGILAICVWFFVAFSFVTDMLGLYWTDRISSPNRVIGNPAARSTTGTTNRVTPARGSARNDRMREMGSSFRR